MIKGLLRRNNNFSIGCLHTKFLDILIINAKMSEIF